jgi:hypothetical protein
MTDHDHIPDWIAQAWRDGEKAQCKEEIVTLLNKHPALYKCVEDDDGAFSDLLDLCDRLLDAEAVLNPMEAS